MWDDQFLFVFAALVAIAYSILKQQKPGSEKILQVGSTTITLFSIWLLTGVAFTVAIVAGRAWLYWHTPLMPNAGNVLAILLGAVFGGFSARFASSMFNSRFGERDPIIGAAVLARCVSYTAFPYILTLFRVWSTE
jgi:hypothetical protein